MTSLTKTLTFLSVLALASSAALAGHIDLPVRWSQLPDMQFGVDQYSVHVNQAVCSNDYQCTDPSPVVAVRWWGSYMDGHEPTEDPRQVPFELVFHYDLPANTVDPETGENLPYSHPTNPPNMPPNPPATGPLPLWYNLSAQEHYYGTTVGGERVYEYNAYLPVPFDQQAYIQYGQNPIPNHNIFWLDIGYDELDGNQDPLHIWGWHEAVSLQLDNAISNPGWHFGPWANVTVLADDLAFELMVPEPATLGLLAVGGLFLWRRRR